MLKEVAKHTDKFTSAEENVDEIWKQIWAGDVCWNRSMERRESWEGERAMQWHACPYDARDLLLSLKYRSGITSKYRRRSALDESDVEPF